jgi:hypothetical protein
MSKELLGKTVLDRALAVKLVRTWSGLGTKPHVTSRLERLRVRAQSRCESILAVRGFSANNLILTPVRPRRTRSITGHLAPR